MLLEFFGFEARYISLLKQTFHSEISLTIHLFSFFINLFIYLFMAVLSLRCCAWAFSGCGEQGLLFVAVWQLLLLRSTGSRRAGFSSCGSWAQQLWLAGSRAQAQQCGARAQLLRGMWDLPGPGLEPVSPALAGGFLITEPPGKSHLPFILILKYKFD